MLAELTLDTNLFMEYWQSGPTRHITVRLLDYSNAGLVDLAVTRIIRDDVPRDPLAKRINALPALGVKETGAAFTLGSSMLGGGDMLGSERFMRVSSAIWREFQQRGENPPDWRDWNHLHAHYLKRRDVFLTWDGAILKCAHQLQAELNLTVMNPEDYVAILETQVKL